MKRARRVILIALVFLLIGAAVNVGVAWGCVAMADIMGAPELKPEPQWPQAVPERWPPASWARSKQDVGWRSDAVRGGGFTIEGDRVIRRNVSITTNRAGWLLAALQWENWGDLRWAGRVGDQQSRDVWREHEDLPSSIWRCGLDYPIKPGAGRSVGWKALPLMPVWPGFAINTLLYAALAVGVWYGPRATQREIRRRRGLCISCGYSHAGLAEGAVCPECGGGGGGGGGGGVPER